MTSGREAIAAPPQAGAWRAARRQGSLVDCLAILATGAVVALALRPFQDTPLIDDWVYAWSVERLLAGDGLLVMSWSAHPNVAHVLWGALFCLPFGFSFTALRVSTWVAALLGLCALLLLLRELGVARRDALAGVALVGANPVFVVLAASFMTDVPFLAASLAASLAFVRALERRSDAWLASFVALTCVAAAVRVVGAAIPVAAVLTLALHGGAWGRSPRRLAAVALPLGFLAALLWWGDSRAVAIADLRDVVGSPEFRRAYFFTALRRLPDLVAQAMLTAAGTLGVALLPLTAAAVTRRALARALPALAVLVVFAGFAALRDAGWPPPLAPSFTWTWGELGATEALVAGREAVAPPAWLATAATCLAFASSALAAGLAIRRLSPGESFVAWSFAAHLALVAVLWLFYDRYFLALLPLAVALVLTARPAVGGWRRAVLLAGVALFASASAVGMRDHLAYNAALWEAVERLRARGAADAEIDGGYVVNGWLHFSHPERAPRDAQGRLLFPWLTHPGGTLRYQITNRPLPGWRVLERVPFRRWAGRSGALYVLERAPDGA